VEGSVGGDAVQGGDLGGSQRLWHGVLVDELGGDIVLGVETGGDGAGRLPPFVQEAQVRGVPRPALETALAALGGVADTLVQVAQQIGTLGVDDRERHRGTHNGEREPDGQQQTRAQGAPGHPGPHLSSPAGLMV